VALHHARGEQIAYLDCDDEYYPDYLEQILRHRDKGDVLVCGYDIRNPDGSIVPWDPGRHRRELFLRNIAAPLGVSHHRKLIELTGGFNERMWFQVDWDFWKRLARAGVEFAYLPLKSGLYHARATSQSRTRRLTVQQRKRVEGNWAAGKPVFGESGTPRHPVRTIAFAATHCLLDPTSGAAVASRSLLDLLRRSGLRDQPNVVVTDAASPSAASAGQADLTVFRAQSTRRGGMQPEEARAFLHAYQQFLDMHRPEVLITYGGDRLSAGLVDLAKLRDIPVVFALHNLKYSNLETFRRVDYVIVPSQFTRQHYWQTIGLGCQVLPNVIAERLVRAEARHPQCVTFVNAQPGKGLFVVARIVEQLALRRPDIPVLIVEGRAGRTWKQTLGSAASLLGTAKVLPGTADPRAYYGVSKLILMPSLWNETFGLVAAEAMLNGIPVLASNRGALPETLGEAGFLFDIPARYTPQTDAVPEAAEVEPWVETIVRLWDDRTLYEHASQRASDHAQQWRPERLAALYEAFFRNVSPQPGPPLVPENL
jgi:glycosyltransferase involved in cell wall biosynthesis